MADNSTLPATGDVIRDKDRAGIKTQIVGLDLGIGGTETLSTQANLGLFAEDAAHTTGDMGAAVWSVRQDTPATTSGTSGDYSALTTGANGETWVGWVGHNVRQVLTATSTALTTATTAYTNGDVLNGELTLASAARISGGGGVLRTVMLINHSTQLGAVDLFLFDSASTPAADNAANSWTDANMDKCVGVIPLYPAATSALNQVLQWQGEHEYSCAATSLFAVPVTRSDHTFFAAAGDLVLKATVIRH